jgi:hypothetical protein
MDIGVELVPSLVLMLSYRNIVDLHDVDRYSFLVGSPIIMIMQTFLIFTFYKYQLYRSSPMDIILACFISEYIINMCFFVTASTSLPT